MAGTVRYGMQVMWVRQFSRDRDRGRGSIDERGRGEAADENQADRGEVRRGEGKAVTKPFKCIKLNARVLVKRLVYRPIYYERMRSPIGRNALTCCMTYGLVDIRNFDRFTVRHWFEGTVTEELLSDVLVLLELIFIRDGSFDVKANEAPLYSRSDIISFISSICTTVD